MLLTIRPTFPPPASNNSSRDEERTKSFLKARKDAKRILMLGVDGEIFAELMI